MKPLKWTPFLAFLLFMIHDLNICKLLSTVNLKGTLCVQQRKDNVRAKILCDSSYFKVYNIFSQKKVKETKEEWTTVYGLLYCIG